MGEAVPFRDVFAGLFFVSIGMLVDPGLIVTNLPLLLIVLFLIGPAKALLVTAIGALFRYPLRTTALAGILLAQSAEFSFVLARIGRARGHRHRGALRAAPDGRGPEHRLLAGRLQPRPSARGAPRPAPEPGTATSRPTRSIIEHSRRIAVICGYGRVGRLVATALQRRGFDFVVVDESPHAVREAREDGIAAIRGNVENRVVLERAPLERATVLVVAVPDPVTTRYVVDTVRRAHPAPADRRADPQRERAGGPPPARRDGGRGRRGGARARDDPVHAAPVRRQRAGARVADRGPAPPLSPTAARPRAIVRESRDFGAYDRAESRALASNVEGGRNGQYLARRPSSRTPRTCTASATRRSCSAPWAASATSRSASRSSRS